MEWPGALIIVGVILIVVGLTPVTSPVCTGSGLLCLYLGIRGLIKHSEQQKDKDE